MLSELVHEYFKFVHASFILDNVDVDFVVCVTSLRQHIKHFEF